MASGGGVDEEPGLAAGGGALFLPGTRDRPRQTNMRSACYRGSEAFVRPSSSYGEAIMTCRNAAGRALSGLSPSGARGTAPFAAAAGTASFASGGAAAGTDPPAPLIRMLFSMRAASVPLPRAFRPAKSNQQVAVKDIDSLETSRHTIPSLVRSWWIANQTIICESLFAWRTYRR